MTDIPTVPWQCKATHSAPVFPEVQVTGIKQKVEIPTYSQPFTPLLELITWTLKFMILLAICEIKFAWKNTFDTVWGDIHITGVPVSEALTQPYNNNSLDHSRQ